ncbi:MULTISPECIES: transglutaminase TgpA family protein [unclassified Methylophaga]|uniref:transglutaminase TgpA family protein n=1 Tax=unclassified Methylophaga TaxID=2629249 RepID=UPI000C8C6208|nr:MULTISPECIES: DUF3488 and transglutaminase-like domain-containing protein [unclassified Methylophaga]MBN45591.1 transglutaminase [Methylophaga sp.]|tara:strand:+ start:81925 stop:83979 length:2055 start_codon:yes stop_codon:yes gene_type:complete
MANKKPVIAPSKPAIHWLMVTLTIIAIPHFFYQPIWVALIFLFMMSWRLMHSWRGWPLPADKRLLKGLHSVSAVLTILLVFYSYGITIGRDAGVALLTTMAAFKIVEVKSLRDYYLSCFMGFFLVITHFFFNQTIPIVILMLVNVILLTSCLITVNETDSSAKSRVKQASIMVLQATPLMLLLFVLFPRISGPIWGLPNDAMDIPDSLPDSMTLGELPPRNSATTGMSDDITIGNISQLIQSDAIAFRVKFDNNRFPDRQNLYWRGPVLWHTDGKRWLPLQDNQKQSDAVSKIRVSGEALSYSMTLEPHDRRWLFALDFPTAYPATMQTRLSGDGELNSQETVKQRIQYRLSSNTEYLFNPLNDPYLRYGLNLPEDHHPRSQRLARQLIETSESNEAYIDAVLAYFRQQNFSYSLTPPALRGDTIDQFLFETRQGFCEHYAASFTILMRAGGIPARIVTGYQGGEINPVDQVLTVRQRDAHAWTEVWLPNKGWLRIDPTAAVSSNRVDFGMGDLLPAERRSPRAIANNDRLVEMWQSAKNNWDALNSAWDMWVVSYGPEKQLELLKKLGMQQPDWQKMIRWLAIGIAMVFIWIAWTTLRLKSHSTDRVQRAYLKFCSTLARHGIERQPNEGPEAFAIRAQQAFPAYQQQISTISTLYMHVRYRGDASENDFIQSVKQFKPQHSA